MTWDDFYKFHFNVQSNLEDIKLAFELIGLDEITEGTQLSLTMISARHLIDLSLVPADFIRAAQVVTGVELSFPVVQLAFRVFDSNGSSVAGPCRSLVLSSSDHVALLQETERWIKQSCSACLSSATRSTCTR